jgi:DNA-binding response OmpR family regulator
MRVLLAEDEPKISAYVVRGLQEQGYAVDPVFNGPDALDWVETGGYDIIVLDIMLPGMDGYTVCREMRQRGVHAPILMLTARSSIDDRVTGLDAGADDYLVKPFALKELLARMRAITRRTPETPKTPILQVADLTLDSATRRVKRGSKIIDLTSKEFAVLECLMRDPDHVLTRTMIAEHVWNYDVYNQSNVVDVYIRNLRRKIDDGFVLKLIHTIRGSGYRISVEDGDETI